MIINELLIEDPQPGDGIDLIFGGTLIETVVEGVTDDGIVVHLDGTALAMVLEAKKQRLDEGWRSIPPIDKERYGERPGLEGPIRLDSGKIVYYDPNEGEYYDPDTDMYMDYDEYRSHLDEAEYQGRKVPLGKPFFTPDGPKKRSVYVKNPKGNVVKVNFGQKGVKIKKNNPSRRKSFRARHNCSNPGPRHKPRYWSCKFW